MKNKVIIFVIILTSIITLILKDKYDDYNEYMIQEYPYYELISSHSFCIEKKNGTDVDYLNVPAGGDASTFKKILIRYNIRQNHETLFEFYNPIDDYDKEDWIYKITVDPQTTNQTEYTIIKIFKNDFLTLNEIEYVGYTPSTFRHLVNDIDEFFNKGKLELNQNLNFDCGC